MSRRQSSVLLAIGAVSVFCRITSGTAPSLCLAPQEGCQRPGGIEVRVRIGASDHEIVGGQFVLTYDPNVLQLIEESAGRSCDPDSPFEFLLLTDDDPVNGRLFCAFGINFFKGTEGTFGPATLGCLSFSAAAGADAASDICLIEGMDPGATVLVDNEGHAVPVDTSVDCPMGLSPPTLTCDEVDPQTHCTCVPNTEDCHGLDTDCRVGLCNPQTQLCEVAFINEGGPCDDGDPCTPVDRCNGAGLCVGEGCTTSSLCVSSDACLGLEPLLTVKVQLSAGQRVINGGQFSLRYDPAELDFVEALPGSACDGSSPFTAELSEMIDETNGTVFYAVGVALGGPSGTAGPATLACLNFADVGAVGGDACLFEGANPFTTVLADEFGQAVSPGSIHVCPGLAGDPPAPCTGFAGCRIPTVSAWGLATLTLLLLIGAKLIFARPAPIP